MVVSKCATLQKCFSLVHLYQKSWRILDSWVSIRILFPPAPTKTIFNITPLMTGISHGQMIRWNICHCFKSDLLLLWVPAHQTFNFDVKSLPSKRVLLLYLSVLIMLACLRWRKVLLHRCWGAHRLRAGISTLPARHVMGSQVTWTTSSGWGGSGGRRLLHLKIGTSSFMKE